MLTQQQEDWLVAFANKGIAEDALITARNVQVDLDAKIEIARDNARSTLETQAQSLIDSGLADFEKNVVPTIK